VPLRDHFQPPISHIASWEEVHGIWPATWAYPLIVGKPPPNLPVWLTEELAISLDLEASYEETCRVLHIPWLKSSEFAAKFAYARFFAGRCPQ
jgi:hypothetical protein